MSEYRGLARCVCTSTCEDFSVHTQCHIRGQQRDESIRVLPLGLTPWTCNGGIQQNFRKRRGVSDRVIVLPLGTNKFSKTLSEPRGEQAVDDRVDCRAEVEEDARQDVDILINVVHQVGPLADRAPQKTLDVKGCPADSKHCHHDCWRRKMMNTFIFAEQIWMLKLNLLACGPL